MTLPNYKYEVSYFKDDTEYKEQIHVKDIATMVIYIQPSSPGSAVTMKNFTVDFPYARDSNGLIFGKPAGITVFNSGTRWPKPTVVDMASVNDGYYYYRVVITPPSSAIQVPVSGLVVVTFQNLEINSYVGEADILIIENPVAQAEIGPLSFSIFKYPREFLLKDMYFTALPDSSSAPISIVAPGSPFYINWTAENPEIYHLTLSWKSANTSVNKIRVEDRGSGLITYPLSFSIAEDTVFTLTAVLNNSKFVQLSATLGTYLKGPMFSYKLTKDLNDTSGNNAVASFSSNDGAYSFVTDTQYGSVLKCKPDSSGISPIIMTPYICLPVMYTKSIWIKPNFAVANKPWQVFMGCSLTNTSAYPFHYSCTSPGQGRAPENYIRVGHLLPSYNSTEDYIESSSRYSPGVWIHLTTTFDGSTWRLYWNGKLDNVQAARFPNTWTGSNASYICLGNLNISYNRGFDGYCRDARVYDYVLSPNQVASIYSA